MVSVLLSTYNETVNEIEASVKSILTQTYQNIELIVVMDNPKNEEVCQWIKMIANTDGRVKCIVHECNKGLVNSLNDAFAISKGEFIARMDADDISMPNRIEKQVRYMEEHPNCGILGTKRIDMAEDGSLLPTLHKVVTSNEMIRELLRYGNAFTHPTIMLRREVMKELRGYREIPSAEDYDLYLRGRTLEYTMANLTEPLLYYRVRQVGISRMNPYKVMCGSHYALKCIQKRTMIPYKYPCEKDSYIHNYQNYLNALSKRRLGKVCICITKDIRLLYELYRNIRFKWIMKHNGE